LYPKGWPVPIGQCPSPTALGCGKGEVRNANNLREVIKPVKKVL